MGSDIRQDVLVIAGTVGFLVSGLTGSLYGLLGVSAVNWGTDLVASMTRQSKTYII